VDIRFVFATNKDLKAEIKEKRFRTDLFFRINTFTITLPPLREKKEDIALLADYFLDKFNGGGTQKRFSPRAISTFIAYDWPGNVRELENVIERSVLLSGRRPEILAEDFPEDMLKNLHPDTATASPGTAPAAGGPVNLSRLEDEHIRTVLISVDGNKSEAARLLGISRKKLYSKLRKDGG